MKGNACLWVIFNSQRTRSEGFVRTTRVEIGKAMAIPSFEVLALIVGTLVPGSKSMKEVFLIMRKTIWFGSRRSVGFLARLVKSKRLKLEQFAEAQRGKAQRAEVSGLEEILKRHKVTPQAFHDIMECMRGMEVEAPSMLPSSTMLNPQGQTSLMPTNPIFLGGEQVETWEERVAYRLLAESKPELVEEFRGLFVKTETAKDLLEKGVLNPHTGKALGKGRLLGNILAWRRSAMYGENVCVLVVHGGRKIAAFLLEAHCLHGWGFRLFLFLGEEQVCNKATIHLPAKGSLDMASREVCGGEATLQGKFQSIAMELVRGDWQTPEAQDPALMFNDSLIELVKEFFAKKNADNKREDFELMGGLGYDIVQLVLAKTRKLFLTILHLPRSTSPWKSIPERMILVTHIEETPVFNHQVLKASDPRAVHARAPSEHSRSRFFAKHPSLSPFPLRVQVYTTAFLVLQRSRVEQL
eukprot:scaffold1014_cov363-Pavlova_lutheri.AAC.4